MWISSRAQNINFGFLLLDSSDILLRGKLQIIIISTLEQQEYAGAAVRHPQILLRWQVTRWRSHALESQVSALSQSRGCGHTAERQTQVCINYTRRQTRIISQKQNHVECQCVTKGRNSHSGAGGAALYKTRGWKKRIKNSWTVVSFTETPGGWLSDCLLKNSTPSPDDEEN